MAIPLNLIHSLLAVLPVAMLDASTTSAAGTDLGALALLALARWDCAGGRKPVMHAAICQDRSNAV